MEDLLHQIGIGCKAIFGVHKCLTTAYLDKKPNDKPFNSKLVCALLIETIYEMDIGIADDVMESMLRGSKCRNN